MVAFIDQHRDALGIESICTALPIAPSTYFRHKAQQVDPDRRSARARARTMCCGRSSVASGTRISRSMGRARCGRRWGVGDDDPAGHGRDAPCGSRRAPLHPRPNQLWVSDFTYVATWRGVVYVAFVIDVFARRIVGWRAAASMRTDLALDALEQAIYDRCDADTGDLVHHSDRGTQGEFNRSLQQLHKEKLQWVLRNDVGLIARDAAPSVHQVVRRRDVASIDRRSGRPSRAVCRAGRPHSTPAYRNRLERGGFARMAACRRPT